MAKLIYMGTPDYAVPSMRALLDAGHTISLLLCQPDKKRSRGHIKMPPPTKKFALEQNIEVFQPTDSKDPETIDQLKQIQADFFVVIAYGKILPRSLLNLPSQGCINVHGSLLPQWRGAAPIQFSILAGDEETGVCSMLMDEGMDTGDILLSDSLPIDPEITVDHLSQQLANLSAEIIVKTIDQFNSIIPQQQDHENASYTRLITKEDRVINWHLPAITIYNRFRALTPQPGVYTTFRNKRLMLKSLRHHPSATLLSEPGTILKADSSGIWVSTAKGEIQILSCQPENRKTLTAQDFINGYQVKLREPLR